MNYRKILHQHSPFLHDHVMAIYEIATGEQECAYQTLPNGIIGLSVIMSGSARYESVNEWINVPRVSLYGLIKNPKAIRMSPNCREISVGFNPACLSSFIKMPLHLLAGCFTEAAEVFSKDAVAQLEEQFLVSGNDSEILAALEGFLKQCLLRSADRGILGAYQSIIAGKHSRVTELASDIGASTRTLLNKFNCNIGLSPKELMRICRINRSLQVNHIEKDNLTGLAYLLGYFDQAHFIHEFRETLGISPQNYFNDPGRVSDFYNSGRWTIR